MNVLILASFYPSYLRPNSGIFFQDQAEALHRAGHQVGVIILPRIRGTYLYTWRRNLPMPPLITRRIPCFLYIACTTYGYHACFR